MLNVSHQSHPTLPILRRYGVVVVACIAVVWVGYGAFGQIDWPAMAAAFQSISVMQWIGASACIWLSFHAVGYYDAIWHKVRKTGVSPRAGRLAGMASIAIGQAMGADTVTAALARWQCFPQLSLVRTTHLSVSIALSFLSGWAIFAAISATVLGFIALWQL